MMEFRQQPGLSNTRPAQIEADKGQAQVKKDTDQAIDQASVRSGQERDRLSLDGIWQFQFDATDTAELQDLAEWREAHVPMPWQAEFEDLREQAGTGWSYLSIATHLAAGLLGNSPLWGSGLLCPGLAEWGTPG